MEQVIPRQLPLLVEGKSRIFAHPCVLKSSAVATKKNRKEKVEVSVCKRLLNTHYSTEKRCVPSWETS